MSDAQSLYDRIGGHDAVTLAVTLLYEQVLADDRIARFFSGLDVSALIDKQVAFMTIAFGGQTDVTPRDLATAHARLVGDGMNDSHFDALVGHLEGALGQMEIAPALVQEVLAVIEGTRDHVLGRHSG